jgi:hypothetical protein
VPLGGRPRLHLSTMPATSCFRTTPMCTKCSDVVR